MLDEKVRCVAEVENTRCRIEHINSSRDAKKGWEFICLTLVPQLS